MPRRPESVCQSGISAKDIITQGPPRLPEDLDLTQTRKDPLKWAGSWSGPSGSTTVTQYKLSDGDNNTRQVIASPREVTYNTTFTLTFDRYNEAEAEAAFRSLSDNDWGAKLEEALLSKSKREFAIPAGKDDNLLVIPFESRLYDDPEPSDGTSYYLRQEIQLLDRIQNDQKSIEPDTSPPSITLDMRVRFEVTQPDVTSTL
jgi:hypothetical protein